MTRVELYTKLVAQNGITYQINQAIQELAELIQDLTKVLNSKPVKRNVIEEMGDVEISLEVLKQIFDPKGQKIKLYKDFKLKRVEMFELEPKNTTEELKDDVEHDESWDRL